MPSSLNVDAQSPQTSVPSSLTTPSSNVDAQEKGRSTPPPLRGPSKGLDSIINDLQTSGLVYPPAPEKITSEIGNASRQAQPGNLGGETRRKEASDHMEHPLTTSSIRRQVSASAPLGARRKRQKPVQRVPARTVGLRLVLRKRSKRAVTNT